MDPTPVEGRISAAGCRWAAHWLPRAAGQSLRPAAGVPARAAARARLSRGHYSAIPLARVRRPLLDPVSGVKSAMTAPIGRGARRRQRPRRSDSFRQLADQGAGRDGSVALVDPVAEHIERDLGTFREARRDPAAATEPVARGRRERQTQGGVGALRQLDGEVQRAITLAQERENLAADLDSAVAPGKIFDGFRIAKRELAQLLDSSAELAHRSMR